MHTDAQVRLLRRKLMEGRTQEGAAAAAGMSVRSARTWQKSSLPSQSQKAHDWRTRPDPFDEVWESELVPLLEADEKGALRATTLIELLNERHPGQFTVGQVRTLQRRLRDWRALRGPAKEVFFEQDHFPGDQGSIDFTDCRELGVTIRGIPFAHLLFAFRLAFSGWTWVCLAFRETFEALVEGLQGALWALGGVPRWLRHDCLSAATHELKHSGGRALNRRFRDVLDHYGLVSRRIQVGKAHENGVVEQEHRQVKSAVAQALVIRASRDFASEGEYEAFVREVVDRTRNRLAVGKLAEEKGHLEALPSSPLPNFTTFHPKVRKWSTVQIGGHIYSVPSRLIDHTVDVRQYAEHLEVYFRGNLVERIPRLRGEYDHRIDYRHVIWSLVRKPGAFAHYRYRQDLFPSITFRRAYDALRTVKGERADVEYVRILHLAASTMESMVERVLSMLLEQGESVDFIKVRDLAHPDKPIIPDVRIGSPNLADYDRLLVGGAP